MLNIMYKDSRISRMIRTSPMSFPKVKESNKGRIKLDRRKQAKEVPAEGSYPHIT